MHTQLRHTSFTPATANTDLFFGMALVALGLLAFLAYTVYTLKQENGHWVLVRRRGKKEKADSDLLLQATADPHAKKDVDLEGGKRRQYVVEDLYRFRTVTSGLPSPLIEELRQRTVGRC